MMYPCRGNPCQPIVRIKRVFFSEGGTCDAARFNLVWSLVGVIFLGIGKLFSMILGLILAAAGVALSCTIIGAIVGIPLIVLGVTMFFRSLF